MLEWHGRAWGDGVGPTHARVISSPGEGRRGDPQGGGERVAADFRGSGRRRNPRKLGTHRCAVTAIYPLPRRSTTVRNTDLICLQRMADHSSLPATNAHPPQSPQSQTSPARTTPQPAGAPTGKGHGGDTSGRTGPIRASKLAGLTRSVLAAWLVGMGASSLFARRSRRRRAELRKIGRRFPTCNTFPDPMRGARAFAWPVS